ncbi:DUF4363 family protein [Clostridium manihotivorum]|uniref:DUF4363 family protein n=1 Tax=Clostridium manihotivorum TaxID=2320868 RepID=A0A3R5U8M1_9CLOT|nr:DUF4363 family protein [Clostridium manihotivorum]QAA34870.1 hypothetical protein C1I91_26330 [Clostridium manihotivorum]
MFDNYDIRYKIAIIWFLAFILLWIIFRNILPLKSMNYQLNNIQASIEQGDWKKADQYTEEFVHNFESNKFIIQINNATEALISFEHTVGQLKVTVKNKQDSSLEYVGALREMINLVVKPFSGP